MDPSQFCNRLNWNNEIERIFESKFPLHKACRDGLDDELSLFLVHRGQHSIYEEDQFLNWTPAHWAACFGKVKCLDVLIRNGFDIGTVTSVLEQSASHNAAFSNNLLCLKLLIHYGTKIDKKDYNGETALHKAARTGSLECLSLLIANGANLLLENKVGLKASKLAASCGFLEAAKFLEMAVSEHNQTHPAFLVNNFNPCDSSNISTCRMSACDGFHYRRALEHSTDFMETNNCTSSTYHPNDLLICGSLMNHERNVPSRKRSAEGFNYLSSNKKICFRSVPDEPEFPSSSSEEMDTKVSSVSSVKDYCGISTYQDNHKLIRCFSDYYL